MDKIKNIKQLRNMIGGNISDINFCFDDLNNIDYDFNQRYPGYSNSNIDKDAKILLDNIKRDFILFRKRTLIKTVFIYYEGILFALKQIILEHNLDLKENDIINLQEYKIIGPNINNFKKVPIRLSLEENIKFTFKNYGKYLANNFIINFKNPEWENFQECIKIRNKITHPKNIDDLVITDTEIKNIQKSYEWFYNILMDLQQHEI